MYEGKKIHIKKGDYSPLMRGMNKYLKEAKEYTANDIQTRMMNKYIEHFEQGDVDLHKDSQREWVTDKNPVVETNIGFIETYVDPLGVRAEYEGFVALVHKKESEQFAQLVTTAPQLIERLPWPKEFENIIFKQPDFTSIQVGTYIYIYSVDLGIWCFRNTHRDQYPKLRGYERRDRV